jgi:heat shock transcription factor
MARESRVPSFVSKLHRMVEAGGEIEWDEDGRSFNIRDIGRFEGEVLPRYFRHNNYSSFVRQLNIYGFKKVRTRTAENQASFQHKFFQKYCEELLRFVEKRRGGEGPQAVSLTELRSGEALEPIEKLRENFRLMAELTRISRENEQLVEESIRRLSETKKGLEAPRVKMETMPDMFQNRLERQYDQISIEDCILEDPDLSVHPERNSSQSISYV